jgi:hypothetical protein
LASGAESFRSTEWCRSCSEWRRRQRRQQRGGIDETNANELGDRATFICCSYFGFGDTA